MVTKSKNQRIDAVLPLVWYDYERFQILQESLDRFECLGTLWIITRDEEYRELRGKIKGRDIIILPETSIVPEIDMRNDIYGWNKQQIIKLAAADLVHTDLFMIFDADVICTSRIQYDDIIRDGKSPCYRYPYSSDYNAEWYQWAKNLLRQEGVGLAHAVTPNILHREGVWSLSSRLEKLYDAPWRKTLVDKLPWTEFAIYFTHLEAEGLFEKYHYEGDKPLQENCVWEKEEFADWDYSRCLGYFTVVQSHTKTPVWDIRVKMGKMPLVFDKLLL